MASNIFSYNTQNEESAKKYSINSDMPMPPIMSKTELNEDDKKLYDYRLKKYEDWLKKNRPDRTLEQTENGFLVKSEEGNVIFSTDPNIKKTPVTQSKKSPWKIEMSEVTFEENPTELNDIKTGYTTINNKQYFYQTKNGKTQYWDGNGDEVDSKGSKISSPIINQNPATQDPQSVKQENQIKVLKTNKNKNITLLEHWYITIDNTKYYYPYKKGDLRKYYDKYGTEVKLDIVNEYLKKFKTFEALKNKGKHYVYKSEAEQEEINHLFSDLGGMYFRLLRADKAKVQRPDAPVRPYEKITLNGKTYYKKSSELTSEERATLPPPPPPMPPSADKSKGGPNPTDIKTNQYMTSRNSENCLELPKAFITTNGKTLEISCINEHPNNSIEIYNRWGKRIYKKENYTNDWDGTVDKEYAAEGTNKPIASSYYYVFNSTKLKEPKAGYLLINMLKADGVEMEKMASSENAKNVNSEDCFAIAKKFDLTTDKRLIINCIEDYPVNSITVFDRWGKEVFSQQNYKNDWNGSVNSEKTTADNGKLKTGTYYYVIKAEGLKKDKPGWLYVENNPKQEKTD